MSESSKIVDLDSGLVMVATDIHGNWDDYERVMQVYESSGADYLVFEGDSVHGYPGYEDRSKDILDDLIVRGANTPDSGIIALIGNHEMVHPYHLMLTKGPLKFTWNLEVEIMEEREKYVDFFTAMPFAARTAGGVLLNHTGASGIIGSGQEGEYGVTFEYLADWPHEGIVQLISKHLGIAEPASTLYSDIGKTFMSSKNGQFLWEFFMNGNELQYGESYFQFVPQFLEFMSTGHETPLNVMVNGHIGVAKGSQAVCPQQLRVSTGHGAESGEEKAYLIFDAAESYADADDLASLCEKLYPEVE